MSSAGDEFPPATSVGESPPPGRCRSVSPMVQSALQTMSIVEKEPQPHKLMPYALRPMEVGDVAAVAEIDREAFPTTWPPTPLRRELKNSLARYLVAWDRQEDEQAPVPQEETPPARQGPLLWRVVRRLLGLGPERDLPGPSTPLVGFVGVWFLSDEAHITTIATREALRGQGIGELLLLGAIELAMERGSRAVSLEVRVSNTVAQSLYQKYGFKEAGLRKRYYNDNHEDALIMATDPVTTPEYRALFQGLVEAHQERWGHAVRALS